VTNTDHRQWHENVLDMSQVNTINPHYDTLPYHPRSSLLPVITRITKNNTVLNGKSITQHTDLGDDLYVNYCKKYLPKQSRNLPGTKICSLQRLQQIRPEMKVLTQIHQIIPIDNTNTSSLHASYLLQQDSKHRCLINTNIMVAKQTCMLQRWLHNWLLLTVSVMQ